MRSAEVLDARFDPIDHIPGRMSKQGAWELNYRRAPYFRQLDTEALRNKWDEAVVLFMFQFVKDVPIKWAPDEPAQLMERMTHLMQEVAFRGVPMTAFRREGDRLVAAARRLSVPAVGIAWLERTADESHR